MSTEYLPRQPIPFDKIKGISIEGVKEVLTQDTTPEKACLTNNEDYLWAVKTSGGFTQFSRYGLNIVDGILDTLADYLGTEFISEHDEEFSEIQEETYKDDYIVLKLPTPEDPGPWTQIYP